MFPENPDFGSKDNHFTKYDVLSFPGACLSVHSVGVET